MIVQIVCQVWQWIHHGARLEDNGEIVTSALVKEKVEELFGGDAEKRLSCEIFLDIVTRKEMPEFITTLLSESYYFRFIR